MNTFLTNMAKKWLNLSLTVLILLSSAVSAMPLFTSLANETQAPSSMHHMMADEMSEHHAEMTDMKCHEVSDCCTEQDTASHACNHQNDCTQQQHCGQTYHAQFAAFAPLLSQAHAANLPPRFPPPEGKPFRTISLELKPPRQ